MPEHFSVSTIRTLDLYTLTGADGKLIEQSYPLYKTDSNGKITSELLRDADGNIQYYTTTNLSRYLKYTQDADGNIYAHNYAGESVYVGTSGNPSTFSPNYHLSSDFFSPINSSLSVSINGFGSYSGLSLLQLIMLITITRAETVEADLVDQINNLANKNWLLNQTVVAQNKLQESIASGTSFNSNGVTIDYYDESGTQVTGKTFRDFVFDVCGANNPLGSTMTWDKTQQQQVLDSLSKRQDELNTLSQETSITIQSLVNKRDQAYLLGTNSIALLHNGNLTIARNI